MKTLGEALAETRRTKFARQKDGEKALQRAERVVRWLGPDTRLARVSASRLQQLVIAMRETGLAPATLNRYLSALAAVLATAGVRVKIPWQREPRGRVRRLTYDEVRQLAMLVGRRDSRYGKLVQFLAETGMRVSEALGLAWADVELDGPRPHVTLRSTKNGDDRRTPLTAEAVGLLETLASRGEPGPFYGVSQSTLNHLFRGAREELPWAKGDPEVVPHALRHTCASRLVGAGVSLPLVQAWLGHRDYRSTLRYTHVDEEGLAGAARRLQDART